METVIERATTIPAKYIAMSLVTAYEQLRYSTHLRKGQVSFDLL